MKRQKYLIHFFAIAYILTWVLLAPWFYLFNIIYREEIPGWMWALVPFAFIGGWGPSVAALIVTGFKGGRAGVKELLSKLLIWHVSLFWYLAVFAIPPLLTATAMLIVDGGATTLRQLNMAALLVNAPVAYLLALPFGPIGEELGWRGFALPQLLSQFGPVRASLILGFVWTFWHIPMMLWSPGGSIPSFMPLSVTSVLIYCVQVVSITCMMTLLFLRTRGSVLLAILAHLSFNSAENVLFGGLPDLSREQVHSVYLVNVILMVVLALISLGWLTLRPGTIEPKA